MAQYTLGILFLDQIRELDVTPGMNLAYWSPGYEVRYYIIFGTAFFARGYWRYVGAFAACPMAGPNIVLLLPLWLLGLFTYRPCTRSPPPRAAGWLLFGGSTAAWIEYELWVLAHGRLFVHPGFLLPRREVPQEYVIAAIFAANLYGFRTVSTVFTRFTVLSGTLAFAFAAVTERRKDVWRNAFAWIAEKAARRRPPFTQT
jgi:hypothetical protein